MPRWCVCAGRRSVDSPLQVEVLIHFREMLRPTSTGRLLTRLLAGTREHVYRHRGSLDRTTVANPERELWVLHPQGELPPPGARASSIQVLLLDGNWRQAARMRRDVGDWGRLVALPSVSPSRYGLRTQHEPGRYSTAEALALLLEALGEPDAAARLRVQLELHIYAGLRSRGALAEAQELLDGSLLREALPDVLHDLHQRRPNEPDVPE